MVASNKEVWKRRWDSVVANLGKLGEQRHLSALRDGFALLVPLMIAASVGVIMMTFVFGWWQTTSTSILGWICWAIPGQVQTVDGVVDFVPNSVAHQISSIGTFVFYAIWKGIFSFLAIFSTLTISYSLARLKGTKDPFIASTIGLGAFMVLTYGNMNLFGTNGLLVSIIASFISIELFTYFEKNEKLQLKMPAGVPPAVGRAFSKLFPTIFTMLIMVGLQAPFIIIASLTTGFGAGDWFSFGQAISVGIQAPFLGLASSTSGSFGIGIAFVFFSAFLWFFGLHGQNILTGVYSPIYIAALANNQDYKAGVPGLSPSVLADGTQDAFIYLGGAGVAIALVIVGLLFVKRKSEREILKFGAAPSLFNINEPILFGMPLILNFTYVIPFIFTQVVLFVITWLAIEVFRIVPPVIVKIPWTTPVLIGGFLATSSWQGILLSGFNVIVACAMWFPFILISNKKAKKNNEELVKIDYRQGMQKFLSHFKRNKNKKGDE
ncbi:MAG: PTS sugar transporter subunit IIC [Mycoplasma sp.]|nr:PTS sugar transporter subunit IIC [Mycoplasma sp.]